MYFLRHNLFDRIGSRYACSVRSLSLILVILDALHDNGDVDVDDDDDDEGCGARKKALFPSPAVGG